MDAPGASHTTSDDERARLARAHYEICTALTVFCSNVELVRIQLRGAVLPESGIPVRAHLDELEGAAGRLRDVAREMKLWHDASRPSAVGEPASKADEQGKPLVRSLV